MSAAAPRRALVASDSRVSRDPRVLRQVGWLESDGWTVDTLGRGPAPHDLSGTHHPMPDQPRLLRIAANLFAPHRLRNRILVEWTIPRSLRRGADYDAVVVNEVELLPWFTRRGAGRLTSGRTAIRHLDLHEFVPGQGYGLQSRLIHRSYRRWLSRFVASPVFTSRSVVSPGVGRLYRRFFSMPVATVVLSCPDHVELEPSEVDPERISLVHHGAVSAARALPLLIEAVGLLDRRFVLHLMLLGAPERVAALRRLAAPLGDRVRFIDPVDVRDIARRINVFDLEVIFFPPVTANLRHTLPNKLFEAVQGRLGVVIGESPDMRALTAEVGNTVVVPGWSAADLAGTLGAITTDDVRRMKAASHAAARHFSASTERSRFLALLRGDG